MLKDLTRTDWLDLLRLSAERIPDVLVLRGTRSLDLQVNSHRALFDTAEALAVPNGIIDHVLIGTCGDRSVGYASVYGDAMAAAVTHVFGVLGTRLVIQTGCCGALRDGMRVGDLVAVTSAHCGEGAAQYYVPGKDAIRASDGLIERIIDGQGLAVQTHSGPIWTTSALMAEDRALLERWRDLGCIGVEMETASTFAVAEHFNMPHCALLFVFDVPLDGSHVLAGSEEQRARRRQGEQAMIDSVFYYIRHPGACRSSGPSEHPSYW